MVVHPVMALKAVVMLGPYMGSEQKTGLGRSKIWGVAKIFCIKHPLSGKRTDEFDRALFSVVCEKDFERELTIEQAESMAILEAL